jgi:hypothetical protein
VSLSGGGPSGLVLDETNDRLYVLTRFDNSIAAESFAYAATGRLAQRRAKRGILHKFLHRGDQRSRFKRENRQRSAKTPPVDQCRG